MPDPVTNNVSLTLPTIGGDVGTWGTPLNGDITTIDALFGGNFSTAITNADVTLTTTQFQNGVFVVTGTLTGNHSLIVPLSTNFLSTTACGGKFVVVNNGAGAFNLTVKTATTGTSVTVPQGFAANLYSDGFNVKFASDNQPGYALASNGNPNGVLSGTPGSVNTNVSLAWDYANNKLYGNTGTTTWIQPAVTLTYPLIAAQLLTPDVQVLTSGSSATYTTATNGSNRPLYLRVRMVGAGGGGGAQATNGGGNGTDTSFASWTAIHGNGGGAGSGTPGAGGTGGVNSTGTLITRVNGGGGQAGFQGVAGGDSFAGGLGGSSFFAGAGSTGGNAGTGGAAAANTGSGGQGGGASSSANAGSGGGAGEFVEFIITSPAATYTYTVGAHGSGGTAGAVAGGNGADGRIEVIGYWQ